MTEAGILNTLECHRPLPFRASVSTIVSAKLCVLAGSPDQASAGETFRPLQLPGTCVSAIGLPLLTLGEDGRRTAVPMCGATRIAQSPDLHQLEFPLIGGGKR
jgi:hypothetical protein